MGLIAIIQAYMFDVLVEKHKVSLEITWKIKILRFEMVKDTRTIFIFWDSRNVFQLRMHQQNTTSHLNRNGDLTFLCDLLP